MTTAVTDTISAGKFWGIRRLANRDGLFCMLALDQRPPIMNLIMEKRGVDQAPDREVAEVKRMIARHLGPYASAVLVDPIWAYPHAIDQCDPAKGLILTHEDHRFDDTAGGRRSRGIDDWGVEKIKRAGGDAVKVLAWYRPDAGAEVIEHQKANVRAVGDDCRRFDIPFVFELLVYPMQGTKDYIEDPAKRPEMVIDSVREFAKPEYGVDVFKLESPIPGEQVPNPAQASATDIESTQVWFDQLAAAAGRPWVMLSAGAGKAAFRNVLHYAYKAGASGFLAGRAIWRDAFDAYPDVDAVAAALDKGSAEYMQSIEMMTREMATAWDKHPLYSKGPVLAGNLDAWPASYAGFGD